MKKIILTISLALGFIACNKVASENELKGTCIPAYNIPTPLIRVIQDIKSCTCSPTINSYRWQGEKVYVLGSVAPNCQWTPSYYNSAGELKTMPAGYTLTQFIQESSWIELVWQCNY